ncbi:MAG: sodium:calcium symporter, partial [Candidatus Omnitrophica bacterium]|nr:sodium:calcium symporter [Candidatus Omnitrophota bacterium]
GKGVVDEMDFWGGTFCLVIFATVEVILFAWVFGINKAWEETHHGADMQIPGIYKPIIRYVTPVFLLIVLGMWFIQDWLPIIRMDGVSPADRVCIMLTRAGLCLIFLFLAIMVKIAWRKRKREGRS